MTELERLLLAEMDKYPKIDCLSIARYRRWGTWTVFAHDTNAEHIGHFNGKSLDIAAAVTELQGFTDACAEFLKDDAVPTAVIS